MFANPRNNINDIHMSELRVLRTVLAEQEYSHEEVAFAHNICPKLIKEIAWGRYDLRLCKKNQYVRKTNRHKLSMAK